MKKINKNLPNMISAFRLFCTPLMVLLFLLPIENGIGVFVALGIFILGSFSDMLDGYIARKYNLVSDLGKLLDSIADKFLQTAGLILVVMSDIITPHWIAMVILIVIILRDILINAIRQIGATKGTVIAADIFGKIKSIFIDVAVIILMLYLALTSVLEGGEAAKLAGMPVGYVSTFGFALLVVGLCLSVLSCINYTVDNWAVIVPKQAKAENVSEEKQDKAETKKETKSNKKEDSSVAKKKENKKDEKKD